ncbi:MAG: C40 family peptidase [Eubacterium sp.]|nr:C40 family peptidase [Eubacterium sp.]
MAIILTMNVFATKKTEAAIKLSTTYKYMVADTSLTLKLKGANASKVTWSMSNPFVGTLNNGVFKARWAGMTKIFARYKGKTYTCKVVVQSKYRVVGLNKKKITISDKGSFALKSYSMTKVSYHSQNSHIAKVSAKGIIKGENPGTTYVIATNGVAAAKCKVKVVSAGTKKVKYAKWLYNQGKLAIRKKDKNGDFRFGPLLAKAKKTVALDLHNIKAGTVKKVVWSSSNKAVADVIPKGKTNAEAKTYAYGNTKISAVIFYNSGKTELLTNTMYVSNPTLNAKSIICFTKKVGKHRQQYVSFSGLHANSKVKFKVSNKKIVKVTIKNNKCKLLGLRKGSGTVTATVEGKKYKVKYTVLTPKFNPIDPIVSRGGTTKINVGGIGNSVRKYSSRNPSVASVALDGTITGKSSGVTYVDVKIANMNFNYRVEVAAKGMKTIINRAKWIVNNWTYSQGSRMSDGFYDCSALVWKGYAAYKSYNAKLGSKKYALPAGNLFDYLKAKGQLISFGFVSLDNLAPGDLFFYGDYDSAVRYSTPGRTLNIYHVAMYAGNGRVVEKGTPRYTYNNLEHIVGVGRVVSY